MGKRRWSLDDLIGAADERTEAPRWVADGNEVREAAYLEINPVKPMTKKAARAKYEEAGEECEGCSAGWGCHGRDDFNKPWVAEARDVEKATFYGNLAREGTRYNPDLAKRIAEEVGDAFAAGEDPFPDFTSSDQGRLPGGGSGWF